MLFICVSMLASVALANAVPTFGNMVVKESINQAPNGFVNSGPAPPDQMLNLSIALVQGNISGLEKALYAVSDPSSPSYGEHLSKEQVDNFVRPSAETTETVTDWLSSNGISPTSASPAGDWLFIQLPVDKANQMFNATFSTFVHQATGKETVRTLSYYVPARTKGSVDLVHPTVNFPNFDYAKPIITTPVKGLTVKANETKATVAQDCDEFIQPSCLQTLYNITTDSATEPSNTLAVSGLIGEFANTADFQTFLSQFRPDLPPNTDFTLQTIDGGENPQDPSDAGLEANLDIQYTVGIASNVPVTFISTGPDNYDGLDSFLNIAQFLLSESNPPQVITTSYNDIESNFTPDLAQRLCNAYMQLGAQGTSVIFSSGDGGVAGTRVNNECTTFVPTFPSGCPYIAVVGSTGGFPEEQASTFSSGGFSTIFSTPSYQQDDVTSYVSNLGDTYSGLFNPNGRGIPDVSAHGENIAIILAGDETFVQGTSASAPIIASIISLINDRLIAAGKPVLGFLNPFLYSAAGRAAFTDITTGTQAGCVTGGFPVTSGWDPVTGLGTPNFEKLLNAALSLS